MNDSPDAVFVSAPPNVMKWQARFYVLAQLAALFILGMGLFVAIGVWVSLAIPPVFGAAAGVSAIILAVFFLYAAGEEIVEAQLGADGIALRTVWRRRLRIPYSRIASVSHRQSFLRTIGIRSAPQVVNIIPKGLRAFFLISISFAVSEEALPGFLAVLRERILRKTSEDIRLNGEESRVNPGTEKTAKPPPSPMVVSCLFLLLAASFSIPLNNMYEQYAHEKRLYEEGVRVAAVVDEVDRETRSVLFLPESYDFTFSYTYRLPSGEMRSGTARLAPERIGTFIAGDNVKIVYLPDWPSDSRLADGEPSMFMLLAFATGLGVLCLSLLLLALWPHMARVVQRKTGGTQPETRRPTSKFKPWIMIASFLGAMVLFGWIGKPYAGSLLERVRLHRHGTVVPGRILERGEESGEGASFVFSYRVDGREWMAERGYPRHISGRYRPGDDVRIYVLPGEPGTVQFADSVERNLWLRYGPTLFFALATEIALLVSIVLMAYRAVATGGAK